MSGESTKPTGADVLDKFITIGAQVEKIIGIWMPQVQLGIGVVRSLVDLWNKNRQPADPTIPMPTDAELIQRLRERAKRIEDTSTKWLDDFEREKGSGQ